MSPVRLHTRFEAKSKRAFPSWFAMPVAKMARSKMAAPPFAWVLGSMKEACGSSIKGALSMAATSFNNTDVKEGQRSSCPCCNGSGRRESEKGHRGDGKAPCWFCEGYGMLPVSDLEGYVMTGAHCIDVNEARVTSAAPHKTITAVHAALAAAAPLPSRRSANPLLTPPSSNENSPESNGKSSSGRRRRRPSLSSNPALALPVRALSFDPKQVSECQARIRCPWLVVEDAKEVAANSRRLRAENDARIARRQALRNSSSSSDHNTAKALSPIKSSPSKSPGMVTKSTREGGNIFSSVLDVSHHGKKVTEAVTDVLSKLAKQPKLLLGAGGGVRQPARRAP
eukprot:jgi/Mesvir1/8554/Mv21216-RA.1